MFGQTCSFALAGRLIEPGAICEVGQTRNLPRGFSEEGFDTYFGDFWRYLLGTAEK